MNNTIAIGTVRVSCPDGQSRSTAVEAWTGREWMRIRVQKIEVSISMGKVECSLTVPHVVTHTVIRPEELTVEPNLSAGVLAERHEFLMGHALREIGKLREEVAALNRRGMVA